MPRNPRRLLIGGALRLFRPIEVADDWYVPFFAENVQLSFAPSAVTTSCQVRILAQ